MKYNNSSCLSTEKPLFGKRTLHCLMLGLLLSSCISYVKSTRYYATNIELTTTPSSNDLLVAWSLSKDYNAHMGPGVWVVKEAGDFGLTVVVSGKKATDYKKVILKRFSLVSNNIQLLNITDSLFLKEHPRSKPSTPAFTSEYVIKLSDDLRNGNVEVEYTLIQNNNIRENYLIKSKLYINRERGLK